MQRVATSPRPRVFKTTSLLGKEVIGMKIVSVKLKDNGVIIFKSYKRKRYESC